MNSLHSPVAGRSFQPLFLLLSVFCASTASAAVYTFNNLNPGQLSGSGSTTGGQDNWRTINTNNSSYVVKAGTGFDTSLVAGNPGTDNGSGFDVHINGRTNDSNFTFGNLTGAIGLTLSFDTQVHNITSGQDEFINFGLAAADFSHGSPGFAYRQSANGSPAYGLGSSAASTTGNLPATPTNDWIRLSFVMDFTTNGGQGTGSLYYTDLTASGSPQLITSGFNLGNPTPNTSFWNTMWSRSDFDSSVVFDNLTVIPTFAIPEVSNAWVAAACALLIGAHLVRSRRRSSVTG
jgi:hypothetical protein